MSAVGVGRPWMRATFPIATPDAEWRIGIGNAYGGNAIAEPPATNPARLLALIADDRGIELYADDRGIELHADTRTIGTEG